MKKIGIILSLLFLSACSLSNTPSGKVEAYLNQFNSLSDSVTQDIETSTAAENLSSSNQAIYKEVLTRQYKDMKYEIKDEAIDGDNTTVKVKVTVYDLYKSIQDSQTYLNTNIEEFYTNSAYDDEKYTTYKLNNMNKASDTIDYELDFYLTKQNKEWVLQNPDLITLEKLNGLYNYSVQ